MNIEINIIFAFRNRETNRIKSCMDSLKNQQSQNFQVVFIDYGSKKEISLNVKKLLSDYGFVRYFYLPVQNLLWNKSKALNFGILQSRGDYIFIADVDLIFHPKATMLLQDIKNPEKFCLFKLGYLDERESYQLQTNLDFEIIKPGRYGTVNGMVLVTKKALLEIQGFDEFFHFYGAEDEDLFSRLENAGYGREYHHETFFYHHWHKSYMSSNQNSLTQSPRLSNAMRINQQHFQRNRERLLKRPLRQDGMGKLIDPGRSRTLENPTKTFRIPNISSEVEHFLREEIPSFKGEIIQAEFYEDVYVSTLKYRIKKKLGKESIPYCSLKEVNDMILKEIVFNYRNRNYSYTVKAEMRRILFAIEL